MQIEFGKGVDGEAGHFHEVFVAGDDMICSELCDVVFDEGVGDLSEEAFDVC